MAAILSRPQCVNMQHAPRVLEKYFVNGAPEFRSKPPNITAIYQYWLYQNTEQVKNDINRKHPNSSIFYDALNIAFRAWSLKNI